MPWMWISKVGNRASEGQAAVYEAGFVVVWGVEIKVDTDKELAG